MAQDAELKLKVSLDLGFFRQQLAGLGQAAAGYNIPIQVKFDRRSVQNELNALSANIRRRSYFLEVKTNLSKEIDNAKKLADALRALESGKTTGGVTGTGAGGTFRQKLEKVDLATIRNIYAAAAKAGLLTFSEETNANKPALITALNKAATDASGGFLKAFQKENSRVRKAAGDYGDNLLEGLKKTLKISSPSWEMKKLGEYAADGFEIGLTKGLQEAQDSAVNAMRRMIAALKGEAAKFGPALTMAFGGGGGKGMREALLMASGMAGLMRPETYGQRMTRQGRETIAARYGASPAMPYLGGQAPFRYNMGGGPAIAGLLGPAGTTGGGIVSREAYLAQRQLQAQMRSAERSRQVLREDRMAAVVSGQVPLGGGGPILPPGGPPSGPSGGGGLGDFGQFGRAMGGVSLPGAGTIRELGTEFSFAAKQVLLFGTAYKALAFIQDFPGQVGQAVGQLQSFRNTLQSVTGNAEMAGQANEFILAAVERYNIPLQSARDGFVKLFASMEPAGFAAGEIQNLFLGITKAAATYGMSADKVDRVNYAFAQMASKGQVMSEELKGQLGDVLPGAMGIFAEAAGFKGPDAIQKFSKALEDGVYKGGEMRKLLKNVADGMNKEFGPGAEGAAKTFQGAMNRMQNALASFYESFEPAAISVVNQVAMPLVRTLKDLTEGVNAYFKGQAAATPAAQEFANTLKILVPTMNGIADNIKTVLQGLSVLGNIFAYVALQVSRLLALPIVGYLASAYAQFLVLNTVITFFANSAMGAAIAAIVRFIAQGVIYAQVTLGMRVATQQTTVAMYQFGTAVQTVMIKSVIGIALVAISAFIAKIVELRGQLAAISGDAKSMEDMAKASAKLGDVAGTREAVNNIKDRLDTYKQLQAAIASAAKDTTASGEGQRSSMSKDIKLTTALGNKMVELGLINANALKKTSNGYKLNEMALGEVNAKINENIASFEKASQKSDDYVNQAIAANKQLKEQSKISAPDLEEGKKRKIPLNEMLDLESQRGFKMREADAMARLNDRIREAKKAGNEYEAESLESTREALRLSIETAAVQDYITKLIDEEASIVGSKTLTQKAFDNKLEDAKVQYYIKQKDLKEALGKLGDKEREQQKKIREEQEKFASTLVDLKFENGLISTQEYNRLKIDRQIQEVLREFPLLTKQQKDEVAGVIRNKQTQLRTVKEEIELLRAVNDIERRRIQLQREGYSEGAIKQILDLEKIRDNIQDARKLIDDFVTSTSSDYKGFLKAVISGEDAADALREFQKGLKDRVVTIFLDFTMKPVEDFFKNVAGGKLIETLFPKTEAEKNQAKIKDPVQANTEATNQNTEAVKTLTSAIQSEASNSAQSLTSGGGLSPFLAMPGGMLAAAGLSYGNTKPATNTGMQSIGSYDWAGASEGMDSALSSVIETINKNAEEAGPNGATGQKWKEGLGKTVQGIGIAAGAIMGIAAGIQQVKEGGTSNVLAGIGSILLSVGGAIGGFAGLFKGAGKAANGAVWKGGFQAFANGGTVQGPTLGLIGEGKYNEAIVPLPDGRSIPVQMQGDSIRDRMNNSNSGAATASPVLSMNFETTTINNVEYVSREQLERAMIETRKLATRDGARQGANLAIDKIQQSPNTRRRIGI